MSTSTFGAIGTLGITRIFGSASAKLWYPSPFFDIASTYLPKSVRELFRYCEYYFMVHPIIHQAITKMAEYPITDIVIEEGDKDVRDWWDTMLNEKLETKSFLIETGLDYFTYGNAFVVPIFPFVKYLICSKCKSRFNAELVVDKFTWNNYSFTLSCPKCGTRSKADVEEEYPMNIEKFRFGRLNPQHVLIDGSEFGDKYYFYNIPQISINEWLMGQRWNILATPQPLLDAAKKQEQVIWNKYNLFHMKRGNLSGFSRFYGVPLIMPALKDIFILQVFKKTLEVLLLEKAVPLRILFPQAATASGGPTEMTQLTKWKSQVEETLKRWKLDPGYIGILSWPLGQQEIGGDARVSLMLPELINQIDIVLASIGVPKEFIMGGTTWTGTNVSMRMLENHFLNYRSAMEKLLKFMIDQISKYTGFKKPNKVSFKPFRMVDDLQRKMYYMQLNQARKISDTTLLDFCDLDIDREIALISEENIKQQKMMIETMSQELEIHNKIETMKQKMQIKSQKELQEYAQDQGNPQGEQGQVQQNQGQIPENMQEKVEKLAKKLIGMDEQMREEYLKRLDASYPEIGGAVRNLIEQMKAAGMGNPMNPLPEQKPPRRIE
uniref:Uncharacterized protein n=1 Tax=Dictyoglomus turgidum TaxID=513050 RepID=A0A7C3SP46_9BACT